MMAARAGPAARWRSSPVVPSPRLQGGVQCAVARGAGGAGANLFQNFIDTTQGGAGGNGGAGGLAFLQWLSDTVQTNRFGLFATAGGGVGGNGGHAGNGDVPPGAMGVREAMAERLVCFSAAAR